MISPKVMRELHQAKLVPTQFTVPKPGEHAWSPAEQRRFWEAIERFPQGPWTTIAAYVGSKTTRQAMTHAQKLRQKLSRWKRRVRSDSVSSAGSNASASASVVTLVDGSTGSESPPTSPTEYGEVAKLRMMDHIEEEDGEPQHDVDGDGCEPMHIKTELNDEVQQLDQHYQVHDAHDDCYLEHVLSDIEPVLEHVAHFTNGSHSRGNNGVTRSGTSTNQGNAQTVYFTHHANMVASEHKTMELSMWNQQRQHPMYYQRLHHCSSPSPSAAMHYTPAETGHQYNCYHL